MEMEGIPSRGQMEVLSFLPQANLEFIPDSFYRSVDIVASLVDTGAGPMPDNADWCLMSAYIVLVTRYYKKLDGTYHRRKNVFRFAGNWPNPNRRYDDVWEAARLELIEYLAKEGVDEPIVNWPAVYKDTKKLYDRALQLNTELGFFDKLFTEEENAVSSDEIR